MSKMNIDSIKKELKKFITEEFSIFPNSLKDNISLIDEGWLDSYGVVKLVMFIEDCFGVEISLEEINPETLHSIESTAKFVWQKISAKKGTYKDIPV